MNTPLLNAALSAAARGWHVFPLRPSTKRPALHSEQACARTGPCASGHRKWEARATNDPDRIRAAWSRAPFNVGIATGPSGLIVIDLDMPKDQDNGNGSADAPCGAATFEALCERTGQPVPRTRTIRTASGGQHLYFTAPAAVRLHNTAGTLAPLVDTRAWGGYVVASGSVVDGRTYEIEGPALLNPLPPGLLALLIPPHPSTTSPCVPPLTPTARTGRAAEAALTWGRRNVRQAPEGTRNVRLLESARAMGRFVAWGDIPRHVVEDAFQGEGEAAGLTAAECRTTIRSALDWSIRTCRPRTAA
ncbi:bifunctional DNA primase/polymerase [Streptomyces fructofermentans]|uniref:DNA primase n=1 Tax=Streptomyces fructofermentans TaxID=152141 RepID=A0A918K619_9ACTN|nr:bifunctional DNA primase/polymerase [Streptomyces fructofermentans]GGX50180.1 DNA primase [Streptomyces fructofermentans]